jgi:hypothetical protein
MKRRPYKKPPWKAVEILTTYEIQSAIPGDLTLIAELPTSNKNWRGRNKLRGNAKLMAAAPELFESLYEIMLAKRITQKMRKRALFVLNKALRGSIL